MSNAHLSFKSNTNHTLLHHSHSQPDAGRIATTFAAPLPWAVEPPAPAILILRLPQLLQKIGICRSKVYSLLDASSRYYDKDFPKPIRLGLRSVGWNLAEVESWLQTQSMKRTGGAY